MRINAKRWLQPHRLVAADTAGSDGFSFRPLTPVIIVLLLFGGTLLAGYLLWPAPPDPAAAQKLKQLTQEKKRLAGSLAEQQALLAMRDDQIDGMQQALDEQQQSIETMQSKLNMYDSILNLRKKEGVHIFSASAHWQEKNRLAYSILLVKGGSKTRYAAGHIILQATAPDHQQVELKLGRHGSISYDMETHTLLEGTATWNQSWRPEQLTLIVLNPYNKEVARSELTIE